MTLIQLRRGTAAQWTSANPTLSAGELGVETDTGFFKLGNGTQAWTALGYAAGGTADNSITKAKMADDAVGWAELDASGTPTASTFIKVDAAGNLSAAAPSGSGDASTNTTVSVDGEMVVFSGTGGKTLKRGVGSGIVKLASGVPLLVTAPAGALVGDTDQQTLSLKTLVAPRMANNDFIIDGNGNEYLVFGQTASAVNEIKLSNAPTGTGPKVAAQGGDAAVRLNLDSKGGAGVWADGDRVVTRTAVQVLTNTVVEDRIQAITTSPAAPAVNVANVDVVIITGQTIDITSMSSGLSGTARSEQPLRYAITGTAARAITWGASFESGAAILPTTTVTTQRLDVCFFYNLASGKWRCMASASA